MDWHNWLQDVQYITWDKASLDQTSALAAKLNADVLRAAEERLQFEDEPSTFVRALHDLGGKHD